MTISKTRRSGPRPVANYESGLIAEPLLAFGGGHRHIDPKTGLGLYGPYSPTGQRRPPLSSITVGIVGPASMVGDAEQWLQACRGILLNDGSEPFLYPHFPGFNDGHPFQCQIVYGDTWREGFRDGDLRKTLSETNFFERVRKVSNLYVKAIEVLAQRDPKPHVILCCISQEIIDYCTVITKFGQITRVRVGRSERRAEEAAKQGQGFLWSEMDPTLGIEDEVFGHQNLRRAIKAEAMQFGIPSQLVWPNTLRTIATSSSFGQRKVQDISTRAWNFMTALYHKAGGSPWRLAEVEPNVCFVGISFYKEGTERNMRIRTSMAQAFTSAGDGYVLRGNSFEWDEEKGRSPHLDQSSASALMREVLDLYQKQNRGNLPGRIAVHKTSRYWDDELAGFEDACQSVARRDFVTLGSRGIQFYRPGEYPALRGTYVKFGVENLLLYTVGYIPFLRTYPGARVPHPLEILEHHGDSPWNVILQEILALTKMNWNTADFACSEPVTVAFSHRVGQILAELPSHLSCKAEYRFYM